MTVLEGLAGCRMRRHRLRQATRAALPRVSEPLSGARRRRKKSEDAVPAAHPAKAEEADAGDTKAA